MSRGSEVLFFSLYFSLLTPYHSTGFILLSMRIGQIAKRAGVNVETIRFYERKGLLTQPPRNGGGYRHYPKEAITRIRFIKRAKELGFSLTEIGELLFLQSNPKATCADVKEKAERKILTIYDRIKDLQKMKRSLESLAATCKGRGPLNDCPIIECFETTKETEEWPWLLRVK